MYDNKKDKKLHVFTYIEFEYALQEQNDEYAKY